MSKQYRPQEIEPKWQQEWEKQGLHRTMEDPERNKWYFLTMLPYPSGELHIGHWYAMTPSEAAARFMRMNGYNVFFPIGFDAFGLPAENAAIRHNIHPKEWTYKNIERMRRQLRSMGAMWAWDREAVTCDPRFYRWTQWFFLRLYDHDLAYKEFAPVDFCPTCNTTLAREQVWGEDHHCERCGTPVIKKELDQWKFRITKYAEELLDFSQIQWPERVRAMQTNWIGRSEGANVTFKTEIGGHDLVVFTTRPDTLWGATFMVLSPEHPLLSELTSAEQRDEVEAYREQAARITEIERTAEGREKTGVFVGSYAINPVNDERIPIWVADYVLMSYGTGAIMAVPAHDQRDWEFARQFGLEIRPVIRPVADNGADTKDPTELVAEQAYEGPGEMINSAPFNGTRVPEDIGIVIAWLEETGRGQAAVNYRLHDWLISRQRMWGAPIPMIYCDACGVAPVPYEDLPVELPDDAQFLPTGESPLKYHEGFRYVKCPKCGGDAERETDTMDTFMCSSWYQYAYISPYWKAGEPIGPHDIPWDPAKGRYWLPVDQYTGGVEHATMHLLYTRFFTKALRDMGIVDFDEPMLRLFNQGSILGEDGEKMSKRRGNVVAPDELVQQYGADAVRAYLMFIGPWDQGGPWNPSGIEGVHRFLHRVWSVVTEDASDGRGAGLADATEVQALRRTTHKTIRKVTQDYREFKFNTMVAALMEFNNALMKAKDTPVRYTEAWDEAIDNLLLLMAPAMPHIAEELWQRRYPGPSIHVQAWPTWDEEVARDEAITLVIQVNGKVRDKLEAPADLSEEQARELALASERVQKWVDGKTVRKVIFAGGKLVNIVAN